MSNMLKHFFLLDSEIADIVILRKKVLTVSFLFISIFALGLFGYLNIVRFDNVVVGSIDMVASLVSLFALVAYKKYAKLKLAIILGTLNLFVFFVTFVIVNQNQNFGIIWTIFFPIFVIVLTGPKRGLTLSLLFFSIIYFIAFNGIGEWGECEWNLQSFVRYLVATLVLLYVVYMNEVAIVKANTIIKDKTQNEREYIKQLESYSTVDYLTSIFNRRKLDTLLESELSRAERYSRRVSIAIFDIDDFKKINDEYGHLVGDAVLIDISQLVSASIRKSDYFGRWGGEEFLIIFSETSREEAKGFAERLRQKINEQSHTHKIAVSCSFGISEYQQGDTVTSILQRCDDALYMAKAQGKNSVVLR
jgi:diguanylate cyclase (GGDEF)-like protein